MALLQSRKLGARRWSRNSSSMNLSEVTFITKRVNNSIRSVIVFKFFVKLLKFFLPGPVTSARTELVIMGWY